MKCCFGTYPFLKHVTYYLFRDILTVHLPDFLISNLNCKIDPLCQQFWPYYTYVAVIQKGLVWNSESGKRGEGNLKQNKKNCAQTARGRSSTDSEQGFLICCPLEILARFLKAFVTNIVYTWKKCLALENIFLSPIRYSRMCIGETSLKSLVSTILHEMLFQFL